jgi:energy-coupling factor transporter ATP-binding protein EcfA2
VDAARRALEIAAAGGDNLLLTGPPGSGKTMLARRLGGILPPPSTQEMPEIMRIHSAARLLSGRARMVTKSIYRQSLRLEEHDDLDHPVVAAATRRIGELGREQAKLTHGKRRPRRRACPDEVASPVYSPGRTPSRRVVSSAALRQSVWRGTRRNRR